MSYGRKLAIVIVLGAIIGVTIGVLISYASAAADWAESANFAKAKAESPKWHQEVHKLTGWRDGVDVYVVTVTDPAGQRSNHVCMSKSDTTLTCNLIPSER